LTSFSVTQRTREIGTRRALGATRLAILRYFLLENWIITGMGLTLGIALTVGLNLALAHWSDVRTINAPIVGGGMVLIWCVGLLAALVPAMRGSTVPPVIATRSV
jgi:putative ABC transport system permease protein